MTALSLRSIPAFALAASFTVGLSACVAAPRYPVQAGQAPGEGFEPLQPRYAVRLAAVEPTPPGPAPAPATGMPAAPPAEADPAPRAAPTAEVSEASLAPPVAQAPPESATAAVSQGEVPSPAPSRSGPAALAAAAVSPPISRPQESSFPSAPRVASRAAAVTGDAAAFLQSGIGAGPPRFTIGAPVPPAPALAQPTIPVAPPAVYARPTTPAATASFPPVYARPSTPTPSAVPRPSAPLAPYASAPSSGPRPYSSLYPQGPRPSRGPIRSAGIRSTPGAPGLAPQPLTLPPVVDASPPSSTEAAALGRGRFTWPLRGALISGYGDKGGGQRNDGLNIAAGVGDAVRAAAAGEVVYAGDLVPGSGNLVLVKHPGGWVTAYAHLSRIEVKMRDPITQGQEIGQAGQTGGVDRPQLHFEIRYARNPQLKATPVDPSALLPRG